MLDMWRAAARASLQPNREKDKLTGTNLLFSKRAVCHGWEGEGERDI